MKQFRVLATALAAALLVAACGGGGNGDQTPPVKYSAVVSFGDSLSDAGTYNVGPIKNAGGGMFTVNGIAGAIGADTVPSDNWAQLVSASAVGKTSCSARVGGFGVAETAVAGCTNYAQGGSRVTDPNGIGNASGGAVAAGTTTAGALTEPVVTQIANYVKDSGGFTGNELITVLAGPNDLFAQLTKLTVDATAAGNAAGNTAFATAVVGALAADSTNPATAATAIGTAMPQAQAAAAKVAGATTTTIMQAAVTGAVQAAALAGNTKVMDMTYINGVVTTAKDFATAAGTAAGNQTFAGTLIGALAADATTPATAGPIIQTAFVTEAAKGSAMNVVVGAAAAAAAGQGNTKVVTDPTYVPTLVANATTAANAAGAAAGATAFATKLAGLLAADATVPATAGPAIGAAMAAAKATASAAPGATADSVNTAVVTAAVQAAAAAGNTKVMNMTYINAIAASAQASATTAGTAAGNQYVATTGAANAGVGVVTAAATLAGYVKDMVNKGAKHVVVLNLPDMSLTPSARSTIIYNADGSIKDNSSQRLVLALVKAFNAELQKDLGVTLGVPANGVLLVDFFTNMQNNVNDPGHYALTNTKDVACNLTAPANALATVGLDDGSSLVCNGSNLIAGDTSHYMFADKVHPTPYSHKLLSQVVNKIMIQAGWL
ncbi:hypothetical protein Rfer_0193 [Rhodoferax ferrireducens T118]|uniref:Esterase n=1 Tax=Albidiferax ferrireducens (strain ATCC BAA-621 / DSM 15236 / T118) TaxID=338969 RepID=Q222V2_ALBFT|nr:SGNH/GDSL hydrolase family protein [Rhodoferax ferrireducens]ABD67951.1 hypothetical protein Rfer_0193 [Rhodoferax ferrireducens T118]